MHRNFIRVRVEFQKNSYVWQEQNGFFCCYQAYFILKEERFIEYQIIRCNYPGFIPIACELENITDVDVTKHINFRFYVSDDIFVGHLKNYLKELFQKRIKTMKKSHRLHLLIEDDVIIKHDIPIKEVYTKKFEPDGWLYLKLSIDY